MNKYFLSLMLTAGCATSLMAEVRSLAEAQNVAEQFIGKSTKLYTLKTKAIGDAPLYYIYNTADNSNFVIVSSDDAFTPILGYGDGNINEDDMPEAMKYWLSYLSNEMETNANKTSISSSKATTRSTSLSSIAPLLGNIKWNQSAPYNNMTPDKSAVGCTATAMAQVMRYWKFPAVGIGSNSYTSGYSEFNYTEYAVSSDFSSHHYDWDNMLESYTGNESQAQIDAVAQLSFDCGVALEMSYSKNNSITSNNPTNSLEKYFGYNPYMKTYARGYISETEWRQRIITELQAGRPIIYNGFSKNIFEGGNNVGHCFLLDGYDNTTGNFHFNWGWGGHYDGYFAISALIPTMNNDLPGAGEGDYSYSQTMCTGIQPTPTSDATYAPCWFAKSIEFSSTTTDRNSAIGVKLMYMVNNNSSQIAQIGLALYKEDGTFVSWLDSSKEEVSVNSKYLTTMVFHGIIPSSIADGKYFLHAVISNENKGQAEPTKVNIPLTSSKCVVEVSGSNITCSSYSPTLEEEIINEAASPTSTTLYANHKANFTASIKNDGKELFMGLVGVCIYKNRNTSQNISKEMIINPGETVNLNLSDIVSLEEGNYTLYSFYIDSSGSRIIINEEGGIPVTILSETLGVSSIKNEDNLSASINANNIVVKTTNENTPVYIFTADGRFVASSRGSEIHFNVSAPGLYIVKQGSNKTSIIRQ